MLVVYGIKNCDTVKKALRWLDEQGASYRFHDLRSDGLERARLEEWCGKVGWESLLNRKSTTWRQLPDADKQSLDESRALTLLLQHPTLIKRPVFEADGRVLVGFNRNECQRLIA